MNRTIIFDSVRRILGRGFRQSEVDRLDAAIAAALDAPAPTQSALSIGPEGIALIKRFEGCARPCGDGWFEAYPDPATGGDPWTIGWGATGAGIAAGTVWSAAQCDERLAADLERHASEVSRALHGSPTSQLQFDALVSFHYNTGAIARATLTRLHCAGRFEDAADQFEKWIHAGGKRLNGLVRRRQAEATLYRRG